MEFEIICHTFLLSLCWFPILLNQSEPIINFWQLFYLCVGRPMFSANHRALFFTSFFLKGEGGGSNLSFQPTTEPVIISANVVSQSKGLAFWRHFLVGFQMFLTSHRASNNFWTAFWRVTAFQSSQAASNVNFWQHFDWFSYLFSQSRTK